MPAKNIPFDFVVDNLNGQSLEMRPMFGMLYIYRGPQLLLMLRQRDNEPQFNGVWVAADKAHHEELMKELPHATPQSDFGFSTKWLFLPEAATGFETSALQVCRLINRGDKRVGRVVKNTRITKKATTRPGSRANKKAL